MKNYMFDVSFMCLRSREDIRNWPIALHLFVISTKNGKTHRIQRSYKDTGFILRWPPVLSKELFDRLSKEHWPMYVFGVLDLDLLGEFL